MIGPIEFAVLAHLWRWVFHGEDLSDALHADIRGLSGLLGELGEAEEAVREVVHHTQRHRLLDVLQSFGKHHGVIQHGVQSTGLGGRTPKQTFINQAFGEFYAEFSK